MILLVLVCVCVCTCMCFSRAAVLTQIHITSEVLFVCKDMAGSCNFKDNMTDGYHAAIFFNDSRSYFTYLFNFIMANYLSVY